MLRTPTQDKGKSLPPRRNEEETLSNHSQQGQNVDGMNVQSRRPIDPVDIEQLNLTSPGVESNASAKKVSSKKSRGVDSPVRLPDAIRDLTLAKCAFTKLKNRAFGGDCEHLHRLSEEELIDLKHQLGATYGRLGTAFDKYRSLLESQTDLAKADSGYAPYSRDHDELDEFLEELIQERRARPQDSSQEDNDSGAVEQHIEDHPQRVSTPVLDGEPTQGTSGLPSQHTGGVRNQDVEESSESQSDSPVHEVHNFSKRNKKNLYQPRRSEERRSPRQGHTATKISFQPAPRQSAGAKVNNTQILRFVQAAVAAGWDPDTISVEQRRFCQTGFFPHSLRKFDGGNRSLQQNVQKSGNAQGRQSVPNPGQQPPPAFVTGANAIPLNSGYQSQGPRQAPRVPMPGTQASQGPVVPPQVALQMQNQIPVQSQATVQLPQGLQQLLQPPSQQTFAQPNVYPQTSVPYPQGGFQPLAAPPQGQFTYPPPVGIFGMFGNHSFSQGPQAQFAGQPSNLSHWGYNPYGFREKPLMKIDNVTFDGTNRTCSYDEFRATFEVVCGGRNMPEAQKLVCLKQSLQGDPLKLFNNVVGFDLAPGSLERVMRTLESHYGGPQRIVNSYLNRLTNYPLVRRFDCNSLLDLLTLVEEIYNRYETYDPGFLERDLMMATHIRKIMPAEERALYYSKLAEHQRRDTFLTLRDFLRSRYESLRLAAIADVGMPLKQTTQTVQEDLDSRQFSWSKAQQDAEDLEVLLASREAVEPARAEAGVKTPSPGANAPGQNSVSQATKLTEIGLVNHVCSYCSRDHPIWRCMDFKMLDVRLRYEHVREKKLCFHCLLPDHRIRDCKFHPDLVCGREGCKRKHHRLVHNYSETGLCSIEVFLSEVDPNSEVNVDVQVQNSLTALSFAAQEQKISLPLEDEYIAIKTVTLEIRCGNSKRRVLAALDSCSNNTNIDAGLAEEMGLPILRANIPREMHFLERKAHISSNFVKFVLAPLGSDATFEVSGFTVRNLMSGTPVVDWNKAIEAYPHLKSADIPRPKSSDKIQILLGAEFAELMTPYKVLRGPLGSGAPIAELTDLGWAFTGRTSQKCNRSTCQLNYTMFQGPFVADSENEPQPETKNMASLDPEGELGLFSGLGKSPLTTEMEKVQNGPLQEEIVLDQIQQNSNYILEHHFVIDKKKRRKISTCLSICNRCQTKCTVPPDLVKILGWNLGGVGRPSLGKRERQCIFTHENGT